MEHIIDKETYVRYRLAPMNEFLTTEEQQKKFVDRILANYEDECKRAEEFRDNYIKNGPDKGMAYVIDDRTFNIMWFMLYENGAVAKFNYEGHEIEIGRCICCKDMNGTWYVKAPLGTVYINA